MVFDGGELKNNLQFKNSSSFPEAEWCDHQSNKYKKGISKNVLNFILLKLETFLMMIKYSKKSWFRRIKVDGFPI